MSERIARYCPRCGAPLTWVESFGRERPVCSVCHHTVFFDPKVAVVVFVTAGDRLLLIKRSVNPGKGFWALPAGFVDYDEAPATAAAREALEETGLVVRVTRLLDVFHRPDADGYADIVIAYAAQVVTGAVLAADDAADAGWFARDALPPTALATTHELIARWQAGELE